MRNKRFLGFWTVMAVSMSIPFCAYAQEETADAQQKVQASEAAEGAEDTTEEATEKPAQEETEEALPEGQRKAQIYIVSISGNELTYYEKKERTNKGQDTLSGEAGDAVSEATPEGDRERPEMPQGEFDGQERPEMPDGEFDGRERPEKPEGENSDGVSEATAEAGQERPGKPNGDFAGQERPEMPQGDFDGRERPEKPDGENSDGVSEATRSEDAERGQKRQRGAGSAGGMQEMTTVYLAVAVPVYTDLGEQKTFSILQAGDEAEVLFEKSDDGTEVITEIWLKSPEASL